MEAGTIIAFAESSWGDSTSLYITDSMVTNLLLFSRDNSIDGGTESELLGDWIENNFKPNLKKLKAKYTGNNKEAGFYGLRFILNEKDYKTRKFLTDYIDGCTIKCDGECGWYSMKNILNGIGYDLKYIDKHRYEVIKFDNNVDFFKIKLPLIKKLVTTSLNEVIKDLHNINYRIDVQDVIRQITEKIEEQRITNKLYD